jgi:hypothetical protein
MRRLDPLPGQESADSGFDEASRLIDIKALVA